MSLSPFTARREKKEEQVKERMVEQQELLQRYEMQQQQQQQQMAPPSFDLPAAEDAGDPYASENFDKYLPASANKEQSPAFNYGAGGAYEPPSRARQCFGKLQSGFMIGGALGGAFGFMYGCYAAVVYKHILYVPIAVVQAGGAFGFFLACGTVIRCDEPQRLEYKVESGPAGLAQLQAMSQPRAKCAALATDATYCAVVSAIVGGAQQ